MTPFPAPQLLFKSALLVRNHACLRVFAHHRQVCKMADDDLGPTIRANMGGFKVCFVNVC